jgi:hypothetical protein
MEFYDCPEAVGFAMAPDISKDMDSCSNDSGETNVDYQTPWDRGLCKYDPVRAEADGADTGFPIYSTDPTKVPDPLNPNRWDTQYCETLTASPPAWQNDFDAFVPGKGVVKVAGDSNKIFLSYTEGPSSFNDGYVYRMDKFREPWPLHMYVFNPSSTDCSIKGGYTTVFFDDSRSMYLMIGGGVAVALLLLACCCCGIHALNRHRRHARSMTIFGSSLKKGDSWRGGRKGGNSCDSDDSAEVEMKSFSPKQSSPKQSKARTSTSTQPRDPSLVLNRSMSSVPLDPRTGKPIAQKSSSSGYSRSGSSALDYVLENTAQYSRQESNSEISPMHKPAAVQKKYSSHSSSSVGGGSRPRPSNSSSTLKSTSSSVSSVNKFDWEDFDLWCLRDGNDADEHKIKKTLGINSIEDLTVFDSVEELMSEAKDAMVSAVARKMLQKLWLNCRPMV